MGGGALKAVPCAATCSTAPLRRTRRTLNRSASPSRPRSVTVIAPGSTEADSRTRTDAPRAPYRISARSDGSGSARDGAAGVADAVDTSRVVRRSPIATEREDAGAASRPRNLAGRVVEADDARVRRLVRAREPGGTQDEVRPRHRVPRRHRGADGVEAAQK